MLTNDKPLRILLADDDEDDRTFFSEAIAELKMTNQLTLFNDGKDLMDYLSKPESSLPHILFLDLNMPYKNGLDCLKEIRADSRFKNVSVAIYSTSSSEEDIEETFVRGANVYIKKPSDFAALKRVLSEVITINWQYQTSGLNRDNFLLSL